MTCRFVDAKPLPEKYFVGRSSHLDQILCNSCSQMSLIHVDYRWDLISWAHFLISSKWLRWNRHLLLDYMEMDLWCKCNTTNFHGFLLNGRYVQLLMRCISCDKKFHNSDTVYYMHDWVPSNYKWRTPLWHQNQKKSYHTLRSFWVCKSVSSRDSHGNIK